MLPISLHDKAEIEGALRRNVYLHLYTLGDLDDFFWPYTTWYGRRAGGALTEVVLLYIATAPPTLLGLADEPLDSLYELLVSLVPLLPARLYAHLSGDLAARLSDRYTVRSHGAHFKMALTAGGKLEQVDTSDTLQLAITDLPEIKRFYASSYPGNWFDPRMIETGCYYGIRVDGRLASVAGIHVYSPRYRVAALGNITTDPRLRGRGLATAVTARLCRELLRTVDHIGLNVKADNHSAIAAYRRLGFEPIATYEECELELRAAG
jgi:ribosomal protein S18 acetylase RimI-like enzyme